MSNLEPSAPPLQYDNYGLHIDDEIPGHSDINNQTRNNETDSVKIAAQRGYRKPFYHYQDPTVPGSPFSDKSFQRTFSIRSKQSAGSSYTRQINMFIGEEWENVHQSHGPERRAFTCPPTPKRQYIFTQQPLHPWSEQPEKASSDNVADDSLRYFFNRLSEEERVSLKDYVIQPNPHNKYNHKLHATLHCPCFFFFCLLCCLPGVHYMEKSDEEYRSGHEDRAKTDSRLSTVLFILGIIAAMGFLSGLIYFAVSFVHGKIA